MSSRGDGQFLVSPCFLLRLACDAIPTPLVLASQENDIMQYKGHVIMLMNMMIIGVAN